MNALEAAKSAPSHAKSEKKEKAKGGGKAKRCKEPAGDAEKAQVNSVQKEGKPERSDAKKRKTENADS
jgi:hypothetical protein